MFKTYIVVPKVGDSFTIAEVICKAQEGALFFNDELGLAKAIVPISELHAVFDEEAVKSKAMKKFENASILE